MVVAAGVYRLDVVSRSVAVWTSRLIAVAPRVVYKQSVRSIDGRAASVSRFYGGRRFVALAAPNALSVGKGGSGTEWVVLYSACHGTADCMWVFMGPDRG